MGATHESDLLHSCMTFHRYLDDDGELIFEGCRTGREMTESQMKDFCNLMAKEVSRFNHGNGVEVTMVVRSSAE